MTFPVKARVELECTYLWSLSLKSLTLHSLIVLSVKKTLFSETQNLQSLKKANWIIHAGLGMYPNISPTNNLITARYYTAGYGRHNLS